LASIEYQDTGQFHSCQSLIIIVAAGLRDGVCTFGLEACHQ
jgi:hypothetical protein